MFRAPRTDYRRRSVCQRRGCRGCSVLRTIPLSQKMLEYDENRLALPPGTRPSSGVLDYARSLAAIAEFKRELMSRGEATALFGQARGDALEGILGSIEQTMFGEPLYRTREEKAAHLLYFVIKDHPFSDATSASVLFFSCSTCSRKAWRSGSIRTRSPRWLVSSPKVRRRVRI